MSPHWFGVLSWTRDKDEEEGVHFKNGSKREMENRLPSVSQRIKWFVSIDRLKYSALYYYVLERGLLNRMWKRLQLFTRINKLSWRFHPALITATWALYKHQPKEADVWVLWEITVDKPPSSSVHTAVHRWSLVVSVWYYRLSWNKIR